MKRDIATAPFAAGRLGADGVVFAPDGVPDLVERFWGRGVHLDLIHPGPAQPAPMSPPVGWGFLLRNKKGNYNIKLKIIIHEAEERGYGAEVPSIPGCATRGGTFDELSNNIYQAVEGCLFIIRSNYKYDVKSTKMPDVKIYPNI